MAEAKRTAEEEAREIAPEEIARLKELAGKASPGPWDKNARRFADVHWDSVIRSANGAPICTVLAAGYTPKEAEANAAFIAASREAVPALIGMVEKLQGLLNERDDFIVKQGLWMDFMEYLRARAALEHSS